MGVAPPTRVGALEHGVAVAAADRAAIVLWRPPDTKHLILLVEVVAKAALDARLTLRRQPLALRVNDEEHLTHQRVVVVVVRFAEEEEADGLAAAAQVGELLPAVGVFVAGHLGVHLMHEHRRGEPLRIAAGVRPR